MTQKSVERTWLVSLRGDQSQAAIAQASEISQQYYCNIEQGTRIPSVSVAKRLGKILNFDWNRFYEDDRSPSTD